MVQTLLRTPRQICEAIVAEGAIVSLPAVPLERILVGELRWAGDDALLLFPAFGENPADARILWFDELRLHPAGVCLLEAGQTIALISSIDRAAVDDPDDYRVAWSLWREILPLRTRVIDQAFETVVHRGGRPVTRAGFSL